MFEGQWFQNDLFQGNNKGSKALLTVRAVKRINMIVLDINICI